MTSPRRLGVLWLCTGLPVGALLGFVVQLADDRAVRRVGFGLLVLAAASALLGLTLVVTRSPRLRPASVGLTVVWLGTAVTLVALADFPSDRAWAGGLTLLVVAVTAVGALGGDRART